MPGNGRTRQSRSVKRSTPGTRKVNITIYIFCEGKNTEPVYINDFTKEHGNPSLVNIEVEGARGDPSALLRVAKQKKKELDKAKKKNSELSKAFEVWILFDRDEHHHVPDTINNARESAIKVGFSNPCFEIWPILHIQSHTRADHRHTLQKLLSDLMPNYDHDNEAIIDYKQIHNDYNAAKKRATKLPIKHKAEGIDKISEMNPFTNVHILLDTIQSGGKKTKKLNP